MFIRWKIQVHCCIAAKTISINAKTKLRKMQKTFAKYKEYTIDKKNRGKKKHRNSFLIN